MKHDHNTKNQCMNRFVGNKFISYLRNSSFTSYSLAKPVSCLIHEILDDKFVTGINENNYLRNRLKFKCNQVLLLDSLSAALYGNRTL